MIQNNSNQEISQETNLQEITKKAELIKWEPWKQTRTFTNCTQFSSKSKIDKYGIKRHYTKTSYEPRSLSFPFGKEQSWQ